MKAIDVESSDLARKKTQRGRGGERCAAGLIAGKFYFTLVSSRLSRIDYDIDVYGRGGSESRGSGKSSVFVLVGEIDGFGWESLWTYTHIGYLLINKVVILQRVIGKTYTGVLKFGVCYAI